MNEREDRARFYAEARSDLRGPLDGLLAVEITTTWAGPMCGCLLADHGARVIKLEHPAGEVARHVPPFLPDTEPPLSFMHATLNRNKESLALDLHDPRAQELARELACRADILVENFRPGALDAWGLGYAALHALNPRLVYVSISGYGQWGPERDRMGYDPLAQAESGWMSLNGSPDGEPVKAPTFLGDDLAGMHAAISALSALRHRDQTGEGQHVDIALLDSLLFQSCGNLMLGALEQPLPRLGNQFRIAAPANLYPCADGHVLVGVVLDAQWQRMAALMGRPELANDPRYATNPERLAHREELDTLVGQWVADQPAGPLVRACQQANVPIAELRDYQRSAQQPNVAARDMLQPRQLNGREIPLPGPAAKLSRTPTGVREVPQLLGAQSAHILRELGCDAAEISGLAERGVTRLT